MFHPVSQITALANGRKSDSRFARSTALEVAQTCYIIVIHDYTATDVNPNQNIHLARVCQSIVSLLINLFDSALRYCLALKLSMSQFPR